MSLTNTTCRPTEIHTQKEGLGCVGPQLYTMRMSAIRCNTTQSKLYLMNIPNMRGKGRSNGRANQRDEAEAEEQNREVERNRRAKWRDGEQPEEPNRRCRANGRARERHSIVTYTKNTAGE